MLTPLIGAAPWRFSATGGSDALLEVLVGPVVGLMGAVTGFYDGSASRRDYPHSRWPSQRSAAVQPYRLLVAPPPASLLRRASAESVHPKVVSERLGHSTVTLTLDIYSHVVPGLDQDAAERLAKALHG